MLGNSPFWRNPMWNIGSGVVKGKGWMEKTIYTREYSVLLGILKEAREQAGMTQVQLADKLSQSQSFVSKFERGDRRIDLIQLRTICQILGLSLGEFVERMEREITRT
jgi:ribosome-binding protein aMBF1 (putative translation factor)